MKSKMHKPLPTPLVVNRIYSKIAMAFIVISFILILIILYFAFSRVTITLTPITTPVNTNFAIEINNSTNDERVSAHIVEKEVTETQEFTVQTTPVLNGAATGKIVVKSNYTKDQPLVQRTRFQTKDGLVFRATTGVTIPANGVATVSVEADGKDAKYLIEAGQTFTIPGLNPTLQTLFDSTNNEKFSAPTKEVTILQQADIDNALNEIKKTVFEKAINDIAAEAKAGEEILKSQSAVDITEYTPNQKINAEVPKFTLVVKARVAVLVFNKEQLLQLAIKQLQSSVSSTQELIAVDKDTFSYTTKGYDSKTSTMTLDINVSGKSISRNSNSIFDKTVLRGKNKSQVTRYFQTFPDIQNVSVDFSPSWIPIVPQLDDHININLLEKEVGIIKPRE